jgi:hypothetical protein
VAIVSQPPVPEDERRALELERAQKTASDAALVTWTKVLSIATLLLACGTLALWWATRRLVVGADKTAERQLRSYLFAQVLIEHEVARPLIVNASLQIMVRVTNHGTTPAILTRLRALCVIDDGAPRTLPTFPGADREVPAGIAIGPNGTFEERILVPADLPGLAAVQAGHQKLFCCGIISYEDVLGLRRETGFCWHLANPVGGSGNWFTITPDTPLNHRS